MLCAPDRVAYRVPRDDEEALSRVVNKYAVGKKQRTQLKKNLKQLLGWTEVGNDRDGRRETENFQLSTDIVCLQHTVSKEIVPLVGKPAHIWQNFVQPLQAMKERTMKDLLKPSGTGQPGGWRKRSPPDWWHLLPDGTSLVGLGEQPAVQVMSCHTPPRPANK